MSDIHDLLSTQDPAHDWLVQDLLPEHGLVTASGPPKSGKTLIALSMALHVAAGKPWFGRAVQQGGAVYVTNYGAARLSSSVQAMRQTYGIDTASPFWLLPAVNFADPEAVIDVADAINEIADGIPISLVVVDTQTDAFFGDSPDVDVDAKVSECLADCRWLQRQLRCTVLVLVNRNENDTPRSRGRMATNTRVDAAFWISRNETASATVVTLINQYQRSAEKAVPLLFDLVAAAAGNDRSAVVPALRTAPDFSDNERPTTKAREALRRVLEQNPNLTRFGWRHDDLSNPDFERNRAAALDERCVVAFARALVFLEMTSPTKSVNKRRTTYWWKHVCERALRRSLGFYARANSPVNSFLDVFGACHIPEGIFIAACLATGLSLIRSGADSYVNLSTKGFDMDTSPLD